MSLKTSVNKIILQIHTYRISMHNEKAVINVKYMIGLIKASSIKLNKPYLANITKH